MAQVELKTMDSKESDSRGIKIDHNGKVWRAIWDNYIDASKSPAGYGMTFEEAIADLKAIDRQKRAGEHFEGCG